MPNTNSLAVLMRGPALPCAPFAHPLMRLSDVERFVGIPYDAQTMDCADLVVMVQRELFGRDVHLPNGRERGTRGQVAIGGKVGQYATRTDAPMDGDLVLMYERGRAAHAGVYFTLAHEPWVLHASEKTGCSVLHRMRDLPSFGAAIEGVYAWA